MSVRKVAYILWGWLAVLTLGTVGYECSCATRGAGPADWKVRAIGIGEVGVVEVTWCDFRTLHDAEEVADVTPDGAVEAIVRDLPRRSTFTGHNTFKISSSATNACSPYRIVRHEFTYQRGAVLVVEFADGTRWAKAVELPDPRTAGVIDIDFRTGRRLPPRSR